jgi:hypothetical protein
MQVDGTVVHLNWDDPEDRRIGIESGSIWLCPPNVRQLAADDLFAGRAELNDRVPPEIAKAVMDWRAKHGDDDVEDDIEDDGGDENDTEDDE